MLKKIILLLMATTVLVQGEELKIWKLHTELSFVKTSGNTNTETVSLKFDVNREEEKNKLLLKGSGLYSKTEGKESASKLNITGRWERLFTLRFFSYLTLGFKTDKFSGYEYRINGGPGIGYYLIKDDRKELKLLSSILYYKDRKYVEPFEEDSYTSSETEISLKIYLRENVLFKHLTNYSISLNDYSKYFVTSEISLEVMVNNHISLGVGYQVYYQNKIPDPSIKRLDTTFLTSLIINI